jgi:peptidoglycan/xylan/chitin deacetylase (PgdA/CDA1 family)
MAPTVFHTLRPFRNLFETGVPVLMYHKLGPRPRGVRLKGLYVSTRSFHRHLKELQEAGFRATSLDEINATKGNSEKRIVITFDDGFRNVLEHSIVALHETGFRAIQFIVADRIGAENEWDQPAGEVTEPLMDASEIREWLAAGNEIGSHSLTHPRLTRLSVRDAREQIESSRKKLQDLFQVPVNHFCYPYGEWSGTIADLVAQAGYKTAVTTEFGVNDQSTFPLGLKRITARYPSRSLKALRQRLSNFSSLEGV